MVMPVAFAADRVQERPVTLQLDVNTAGQVTAAKVMDPVPVVEATSDGRLVPEGPSYLPLPEALARTVEQATLKWRFRPLRIAGIAVTGRTWARGTLQFVEHGDGHVDVALRYGSNGPFMRQPVAVTYPVPMMRQDVTGVLAVEYVVEPDGSIDQIRVLKAFGKAAEHKEAFEQAIRQALRASRSLPLLVDGNAVATRMRVPYVFSMEDGASDFDNTRLLKRAWHAIHRDPPDSRSVSASAPAEAVAVDSPFVLPPG